VALLFEHDPDDPLLFASVPGLPTGTAWWHQIDVWYDHDDAGHTAWLMKIHIDERYATTGPADPHFVDEMLKWYAEDMRVCYAMRIEWPAGTITAAELREWSRVHPDCNCSLHSGATKRACTFDMACVSMFRTTRGMEEVRTNESTTVWFRANERRTMLELAKLYGGKCTLSRPDRQFNGSWIGHAEKRIPYAADLVIEFVLATLPFAMPMYPVVWLLERLPEMRKFTLFELTRLVDAVFGSVRRARERRTGPVSLRLRRLRVSAPPPLSTKSVPVLTH
jgi:hypothetical protein